MPSKRPPGSEDIKIVIAEVETAILHISEYVLVEGSPVVYLPVLCGSFIIIAPKLRLIKYIYTTVRAVLVL